ncbi:MAG: hypothetical protein ACKPKO_06100, partial [Candidatus Fonsibacter sp.]
ANDLRKYDTKGLNALFKELMIKKGANPHIIRVDVRKMSQDDKILNYIMLERGREPTKPLLLIKDIVKKNYGENANELMVYPTFVIDRVLKARKIPINEGDTITRKLLDIEMVDNGIGLE